MITYLNVNATHASRVSFKNIKVVHINKYSTKCKTFNAEEIIPKKLNSLNG